MTEPAPAAPSLPAAPRPAGQRWLLGAVAVLFLVLAVEMIAAAVLAPAAPSLHAVTAEPGVAGMLRGAPVDPTELAQVASSSAAHGPLALPALALLDGLLVVVVAATGVPTRWRRLPARPARFGAFAASLVILLVATVVVVRAIARLRFLVALYVSPPFGTITYLLRYGTFPRPAGLVVLAVVMAGKAVAAPALAGGSRRDPPPRGVVPLAVTSLAATVVTAACYAWAPVTMVAITDALAAATVGLAAIVWAGIVVSGEVRRLA